MVTTNENNKKKKKKKKVFSPIIKQEFFFTVFILSFFCYSFIFSFSAFSQDNFSNNSTKQIFLTSSTIYIDGDYDFIEKAEEEGWSGSGTSEDPYIISGLNITTPDNEIGIFIINTELFFIIDSCTISGGKHGTLQQWKTAKIIL